MKVILRKKCPEKKRTVEHFLFEHEFNSADELKRYLEEQEIWKVKQGNCSTSDATKTFYYCNVVSKKKGAACPAKLYSAESNTDAKFRVYRNTAEHIHDKEGQVLAKKPQPLRADLMERVKEYLDMNVKPRAISHQLRKDETIVTPTPSQVCVLVHNRNMSISY